MQWQPVGTEGHQRLGGGEATVCWSASSTAGPGSSEWLPRDVGQLQQAHATGRRSTAFGDERKRDNEAGAKAVKRAERWYRATGEMDGALALLCQIASPAWL